MSKSDQTEFDSEDKANEEPVYVYPRPPPLTYNSESEETFSKTSKNPKYQFARKSFIHCQIISE